MLYGLHGRWLGWRLGGKAMFDVRPVPAMGLKSTFPYLGRRRVWNPTKHARSASAGSTAAW